MNIRRPEGANISETYIRLPGIASDLWDKQVDAERRVLVLEVALELVDIVLQDLWALAHSANNTNPTFNMRRMSASGSYARGLKAYLRWSQLRRVVDQPQHSYLRIFLLAKSMTSFLCTYPPA